MGHAFQANDLSQYQWGKNTWVKHAWNLTTFVFEAREPIYQDCVWTPCSDGVTRAGPLCGNFRANLAASHTDKLQQP